MDYAKDVTIDCDALDVEWLEQPAKMLRYARYAAECQRAVDQAKEKLDVTRAELDKVIRTNPQNYVGELKLTETLISGTILQQNQYQVASKALIDAQYELNYAKGGAKAIDTCKDALENLVRLHGQQYFAGPSVPRDLSKEWERWKRQESVNAGIGAALNRDRAEFDRLQSGNATLKRRRMPES